MNVPRWRQVFVQNLCREGFDPEELQPVEEGSHHSSTKTTGCHDLLFLPLRHEDYNQEEEEEQSFQPCHLITNHHSLPSSQFPQWKGGGRATSLPQKGSCWLTSRVEIIKCLTEEADAEGGSVTMLRDGVYEGRLWSRRSQKEDEDEMEDQSTSSFTLAIFKISTIPFERIELKRESNGHHCLPMPWSEAWCWARVYPDHFWGCLTFRVEGVLGLKVILCIRHYRATLHDLMVGVLSQCDAQGKWLPCSFESETQVPWDIQVLDSVVQLIVFTLPRVRQQGLVAHNDFKCDNVAYRRTTKQHIYVRLCLASGVTVLLAIPTHRRLFYLIDFGWSSCLIDRVGIGSTAPLEHRVRRLADQQEEPLMLCWNPLSDFFQLSRSLQFLLVQKGGSGFGIQGIKPKNIKQKNLNSSSPRGPQWTLLIQLLQDLAGPLARPRDPENPDQFCWDEADLWKEIFYVDASRQTRLHRPVHLIDWLVTRYSCSLEQIPAHRSILEFQIEDLFLLGSSS